MWERQNRKATSGSSVASAIHEKLITHSISVSVICPSKNAVMTHSAAQSHVREQF
jgi:hypothetical protein